MIHEDKAVRRVVFAGTPEFAAAALRALVAAGFEIAAVLTQPDRPAGRGMKLQPSAVKQAALALGLPVWQPESLKDAQIQAQLQGLEADVMVVAAYGLLLPAAVLTLPRYGCVNIHASLLPRWRGAAPVQRAIEAGDGESGVCIMQMDAGLDTGPVLAEVRCAIDAEETAAGLLEKLTVLGARECVAVLQQLPALTPQPQPEVGVTYAKKLSREEAQIDWTQPAEVVGRKIRAFNPVPGAWTLLDGQTLKIWTAQVEKDADAAAVPGTVIAVGEDGIRVACGQGCLKIRELQKAGSRRMGAAAFAVGGQVAVGTRLGG